MHRQRFELTRVRLRHYRSIRTCDVWLGPLTLLVGPNGAGKSNFLDALRLTAQSLTENIDNALRERGGLSEVRRRSRGHPTHFGIHVNFNSNELAGYYGFQVASQRGGDFRISHEECRVSRKEFRATEHFYAVRNGELTEHSESVMPPVTGDRLLLVAAAGLEPFRPVFDGLASLNVYSLNPDAMRNLRKPDSGDLLRRDGSNIASVLERLRRERPEAKDRIEEYLSRVVEGVVAVDRRGFGAWETVQFKQRVAGDEAPWTFHPTSMSDGTLRALGVLTALFAAGETFDSPVGIEEPEVALHPAAAGLLLDVLRDASSTRQVLVTTHSPDLLDSPTISERELLAVKANDGVTQIGRVDSAGQLALRESLYTPGELLRVDQLAPVSEAGEQVELFA